MDERPWTPQLGLARALWHLLIRSVVGLVLLTIFVRLITPMVNLLPPGWLGFGSVTVGTILPGAMVGHVLAKGLTDKAGMTGLPLASIATVFGWVVVILGVLVSNAMSPLDDWRYGFTAVATGWWTTLWLIKATILDA